MSRWWNDAPLWRHRGWFAGGLSSRWVRQLDAAKAGPVPTVNMLAYVAFVREVGLMHRGRVCVDRVPLPVQRAFDPLSVDMSWMHEPQPYKDVLMGYRWVP